MAEKFNSPAGVYVPTLYGLRGPDRRNEMKPRISQLAIIMFVAPFITHCVPSQDVNNLDLKVRNINNRVVQINKAVGKLNNPEQIDSIQSKQASIGNSVDNLNMDMLQIKGQLEETSHNYQIMQKENKQFKTDINRTIADLADQISLLTDQLNQTNERLVAVQQAGKKTANAAAASSEQAKAALAQAKIAADKAAAAGKAADEAGNKLESYKKSATKAPHLIVPHQKKMTPAEQKKAASAPKSTSKSTTTNTDNVLYDKALNLFRKSNFTESYRTFNKYLKKFPKGKLAPNAQFWMGDCYYSQQEYELAILEYQKVIANFPKHAKAPAALLKQGLAFEKLQDNDTAKIVYKKLLKEYPKSEQMQIAKKRLTAMK